VILGRSNSAIAGIEFRNRMSLLDRRKRNGRWLEGKKRGKLGGKKESYRKGKEKGGEQLTKRHRGKRIEESLGRQRTNDISENWKGKVAQH